jgi:hypothetical protein
VDDERDSPRDVFGHSRIGETGGVRSDLDLPVSGREDHRALGPGRTPRSPAADRGGPRPRPADAQRMGQ